MLTLKNALLCAALAVLFCGFARAGENWSNYRGPTDQGLTDAKNLPVTWGEDENVTW